jgi:hypothetical protein
MVVPGPITNRKIIAFRIHLEYPESYKRDERLIHSRSGVWIWLVWLS